MAAASVQMTDGALYPKVQIGERVLTLPIDTNIVYPNLDTLKIVVATLSVYTVVIMILVLLCWRQGKAAKPVFDNADKTKDPEPGRGGNPARRAW